MLHAREHYPARSKLEITESGLETPFVALTDLDHPIRLKFGSFEREIKFKAGCIPAMRLKEPADGGLEEIVIHLQKPDGTARTIEIGSATRNLRRQRDAPQVNPDSEFVLIVHEGGTEATSHFVREADIDHFAIPGELFQFDTEGALGQSLQGDIVQEVMGYTNRV
ncbi:MAG TPA: hypothetical protein VIJ68_00990 [Candidatus Saccharimonadales bacterium]